MKSEADCLVIGAGIIGCCTALHLQRQGYQVLLIDDCLPGAGASTGNAGMVGPGAVLPLIGPDLLRQLPRMLAGKHRSLFVRARALPAAGRWFIRCMSMADETQYLRSSGALHRLHQHTLTDWKGLLGDRLYAERFRQGATLSLQPGSATEHSLNSLSHRLRRQAGVCVKSADQQMLAGVIPGLSMAECSAFLISPAASVRNSAGLLESLLSHFIDAGGRCMRQTVSRLTFSGKQISDALTSGGRLRARHYIVTSGASSLSLLPRTETDIPLIAERGYHIMLSGGRSLFRGPSGNGEKVSVLHDAGYKCVITEMDHGIRVSGLAEYSHPAQEAKAQRFRHLEQVFRLRFPEHPARQISHWSGSRPVTPDSLPYIDVHPAADNLICAFGHGHYGMSGAPATAQLVGRLLSGEPADPDFRLNRFTC